MLRHLTLVKDDNEKTFLDRYKLVVLECPYETVSSDQTIGLLGKIIRFKIESYRREYRYGILPFDGVDMVGTHYLLCDTNAAGELDPVMGVKTITQKKCQEFNLKHPVLGLLGSNPEHANHVKTMDALIERHNREKKNLGYFGSWTIRGDARKNPEVVQFCQRLLAGMALLISDRYDFASIITVAVSKFKVEGFHKFMGFQPLEGQGNCLPPFISEAMMGEQCSLSYLNKEWFTDDVKMLASRYQGLWNDRLEITVRESGGDVAKAA
jgi:hypothetical protein